jgi:3',5'-nucleoside bisphosphate phosphatase
LLKRYRSELHVHTVLSPCAEVEMIPPLIVQEALDLDIHLIAVTDHNSSSNVEAVQKAARDTDLIVLPGMELQTREEVHLLCLFDTLDQLAAWQKVVDTHLPALENDPEHFGEQFIVDETGDFVAREPRLLLASAGLTVLDAYEGVTNLGGLLIPAHVNRRAFGMITNLGFIPTDIPFSALEISRHLSPEEAPQKYAQLDQYPLIQSGDVHRLEEFLGNNEFWLEKPTIQEIKLALAFQDGRHYRIRPGP